MTNTSRHLRSWLRRRSASVEDESRNGRPDHRHLKQQQERSHPPAIFKGLVPVQGLLMLRSGTSSNRCHKKKSSRYEKRACGSASLACAAGSELGIASAVRSAPVNKQVASAKKTIAIQSTLKVYTNGASAPIGLSAVYRRVRLVSVAMDAVVSVITLMQACPNDRVSVPHRNVARVFLTLEQVTVIAFDDRVRLFVHICVHPE